MNEKSRLIEERIELMEKGFKDKAIRINTSDLIRMISGLSEVKIKDLILAGKIFKNRSNWEHKQDSKTGKRYWEYVGFTNNIAMWI